MNLMKDESIKFSVKSAKIKHTKYSEDSICQIELLVAVGSLQIVLPSGKMFIGEEAQQGHCEISNEQIIVIIKKRGDKKEKCYENLSVIRDGIEISIRVEDEYFTELLNSLNLGKKPSEISMWVNNAKHQDPAYKALKLEDDRYEISDWCITIPI
jgi:hypothetical protein